MKISPIITSTLLTLVVIWFLALYGGGPLSDCKMGIMRFPYILGIVPPIAGVLTLPIFFVMSLCDRFGIHNAVGRTAIALVLQLPITFLISVLVTPIDDGMMWRCVFNMP
ncbi:MAG: hypothetical protein R2834_22610 [Rhodothermales bacterium]